MINSNRKLRRIAIDPVTRVEGHGKVTLHVDENNNVVQARLHIVEFRGFEKFIQGRPYWELPVVVERCDWRDLPLAKIVTLPSEVQSTIVPLGELGDPDAALATIVREIGLWADAFAATMVV